MAIQAVQVCDPNFCPVQSAVVFGVVFFWRSQGFLLLITSESVSALWLPFLLARACGQDLVQQMTGAKFYQKYSKYLLQEKQFERIFALLIFLPVAPDDFFMLSGRN